MANATQDLPAGQGRWFAYYGPLLTKMGYAVVPANGKRMFLDDWLNFVPSEADFLQYGACNCSVLTKLNPVLDVDITDEVTSKAVWDELQRLLGIPPNPARVGKAPKFCLVFRTDTPFRKRQIKLQKDGATVVIEWLADGQQFVAYGEHPDTHQPYKWVGRGAPLESIRREALPEITVERADELLAAVEALLRARGYGDVVHEAPAGAAQRTSSAQPFTTESDAPQWAIDALARLNYDDRDTWIKVGMALKAIERDAGECWPRDLWIEWSMLSSKYQTGDEDRWEGLGGELIGNPEYTLRNWSGTTEDPLAGFAPMPLPPLDELPFLKKRHDYSTVHVRQIHAAPFVVDDLVPRGVPTLFSAHGGTGKSYVSLQLAVCVAAGIPFFGHPTAKGKVLVYSCEEPAREIDWRLKHILAHYMLKPEDVMGNLIIINGYGETDNILFCGTKDADVRLTGKYWELLDFAKDWRPALVIVDNISEVYDGNEIERAMVRQFVQSMNAICKWCDAGLVLVGHVDAVTSVNKMGGKGYSGSTAWHNSVRSRLFMRSSEVQGRVLLEPSKNNYGAPAPTMVLEFNTQEKVYVLVEEMTKEPPMQKDETALAVLRAITEITAKGVYVPNTSVGPRNGVSLIADHTGMDKAHIKNGLSRLFNWKALDEVEYIKPNRHPGLRLAPTDLGMQMLVHEEDDDDVSPDEGKGAEGAKGQRAKGVDDDLPEHLR